MTTIELKAAIDRGLSQVPENALVQVLDFLKQLQQQHTDEVELDNFLEQTLVEDKDLLEKLAK